MAALDGDVVCRRGVPPDRSRLQRRRDGRDLHRGDIGHPVSSLAAERLAKRYSQKSLITAGFVVTAVGIGVLLAFVGASSRIVAFVPGLLLIGLRVRVMLTPSVNVVQSSFPEELQAEISGLASLMLPDDTKQRTASAAAPQHA